MFKKLFLLVGLGLAHGLLLAQPAPQPVSSTLVTTATPLAVSMKVPVFRKPQISFGEFSLADSKRRGMTVSAQGFQIFGIGPEKLTGREKGFIRVADTSGQATEADLVYLQKEKGLRLGDNSSVVYDEFADFHALLRLPGEQVALLHLRLDGLLPPKIDLPSGSLEFGAERIQVRCQLSSAGKVLGISVPNGVAYEFVRRGEPVAALSFSQDDRGTVWLADSLTPNERRLLAACCMAILYKERLIASSPSPVPMPR
jgi:hypothetical protein